MTQGCLLISFCLLWTASVGSEPVPEPDIPPLRTVEISTYYTAGRYSGGGTSNGLAEYAQFFFEPGSKIYVGHNSTLYTDTAAFQNGLRQDVNNIGAYLRLDESNFLNLDYFNISDNQGGRGSVVGVEYDHSFDPTLTAGLALSSSSYPGYNVQQIVPRLIWWPDPTVSLNSRVYVTTSSLTDTRVCLSEKLTYFPSPQWEFQLGGVLGSSLNRLDNDTSVIYTQSQIQNGSWFAGLDFKPGTDVKFRLVFEKAFFQGYNVNYWTAGAAVKF